MTLRLTAGVLAFVCLLSGQRRVDPRNLYNRVICVVPIVGAGTSDDPKRPRYAPWPSSQDPNGILAYYWVPSDDGKSAVVEFIARNRGAFTQLLNDKTITLFEEGRTPKENIEAALKLVRKTFSFETNRMVMP